MGLHILDDTSFLMLCRKMRVAKQNEKIFNRENHDFCRGYRLVCIALALLSHLTSASLSDLKEVCNQCLNKDRF